MNRVEKPRGACFNAWYHRVHTQLVENYSMMATFCFGHAYTSCQPPYVVLVARSDEEYAMVPGCRNRSIFGLNHWKDISPDKLWMWSPISWTFGLTCDFVGKSVIVNTPFHVKGTLSEDEYIQGHYQLTRFNVLIDTNPVGFIIFPPKSKTKTVITGRISLKDSAQRDLLHH